MGKALRKLFAVCISLCVSFNVFSQVSEYSLKNGIPVYIRNLPDSRIDVVSIVVDGGVVYLPVEFSGLEYAVFSMMTMGSKDYTYEENNKFFYDKMSSFDYSINLNGSTFSMTSIDKYFDETFERFADGFKNPSFEQKQFEMLMHSLRLDIQRRANDPSSIVVDYARMLNYSGHPYETTTNVTQSSIDNITVQNMIKHHDTLMDSRRISIIASGNFDEEKLVEKLNEKFGKIEQKETALMSKDVFPIDVHGENIVFVHERAQGSGVVLRTFNAPDIRSDDVPICYVAGIIYSELLYNIVRENYGICYTPDSGIFASYASYGYESLYRTSNLKDFKKRMKEARDIMLEGKIIKARDDEGQYIFESLENKLEGYKNKYINGKYYREMTVNGIVNRMASSLLYFGQVDSIERLTKIAEKATVEDILRVFKKYWADSNERWFAVVGPDEEELCQKTLDEIQ